MLMRRMSGQLFKSLMPYYTMRSRSRLPRERWRGRDCWSLSWIISKGLNRQRNKLWKMKIWLMIEHRKNILNYLKVKKLRSKDRRLRRSELKKKWEIVSSKGLNITKERKLEKTWSKNKILLKDLLMKWRKKNIFKLRRKDKKNSTLRKWLKIMLRIKSLSNS